MLVNESTNAMNLLALGNNATKNNNVAKNEEQASFASFLQPAKKDFSNSIGSSLREDSQIEKNVASIKNANGMEEDTSMNKSDVTMLENDNSVNKQEITGNQDNSVDEKNQENSVPNELNEKGELTDEDLLIAEEMLTDLLNQITQLLDISVVELNDKLNELSMDFSDILSEEGMKDFYLEINSIEVSDLVVDEELNEQWMQFAKDFSILQDEIITDENVDVSVLNELFEENIDELTSLSSNMMGLDNGKKDNLYDGNEGLLENSSQVDRVLNVREQKEIDVKIDIDKNVQHETVKEKGTTDTQKKVKQDVVNEIGQSVDQMFQMTDDVSMNGIQETHVSGREIVNQIVEQIRINMNQNSTSMEMQLYPEHLGKIQINVVSKDGVMTARILAESESAKQAIESGLANLKESLEKQELKVDAVEVMVSTTGFANGDERQSDYEQQSNSRTRRHMNLSGDDEMEDTEDGVERAKMEYSGSSVSYMA